jgi:acetoacetate decarboxylase
VAPDRKSFFTLPQTSVDTAAGPCPMPIFYTEASVFGLIYRVEPARAEACLAGTPFEPLLVMGKAMVQLVVFEYRESSIGPYNELALAIEVRRRGQKASLLRHFVTPKSGEDSGSHIINLPVTTESACAAGRELWGFPKYVTGIETDFQQHGLRGELQDELEILIGPGGIVRTPGPPLVTLSVKDGRILRTIVDTDHMLQWGGAPSTEVRILGDGPTAENVARLGLEAQKPSMAWRAFRMRSILPLGSDVGAAS